MSRPFYFGSPSDSDDDGDALPYPEPLARNAFLTPGFTPTEFLSSLHNRHQTLEDLRSELRTRSQELSKELLDLVNENYQEFLGLGNDLRGGDEKVEEVRVGLLGFKREIDALKEKTETRRNEVEALVSERRNIVRSLRVGKDLLEVDARLEELEEVLEIKSKTEANGDKAAEDDGDFSNLDLSDDSEESDDGNDGSAVPLARLTRRIGQFLEINRLTRRAGLDHPFIVAQRNRIDKVRSTLLLDLSGALRQTRNTQSQGKTLSILRLYEILGESGEAIRVVQAIK